MKSVIIILIFLSLTILATRDPINGILVYKNNIEFDNSHKINIYQPPENCKFDDLYLIRYTELKFRVEIKNNYSNVFVLVFPFVDWDKVCANACNGDIMLHSIYSVLFRFIEFKSPGHSHVIYDIGIDYVCYYRETLDKINILITLSPIIIIVLFICTCTIIIIFYKKKQRVNKYENITAPVV